MSNPAFKNLPSVDAVLRDARVEPLPRALAVRVVRDVIAQRREAVRRGVYASTDVADEVVARVHRLLGGLLPVINATGVVLHTNLGRAPWSDAAIAAAAAVARGCELEIDLDTGERGARGAVVTELLAAVCEAEAALVVNNCAAAVLLALTALAKDKDVVVSRGELVEIGGGFRVPDVIASGGARLVEVGTTNRTRTADYAAAIRPDTAVLLRVHRSNFRVVGFVEEAPRAAIAELARENGLVSLEDAGSGSLDGAGDEPSIRAAVREGIDVVAFSGDKLLGGPQAGCLVGKRDVIARLRKHPFYRALRADKVTLAALGATLAQHARGEPTRVDAALATPLPTLEARADALCTLLREHAVPCTRVPSTSYAGGGSLPDQASPTAAARVDLPHPDRLADALRHARPAIVGRIADDRLLLDARTLRDEDLPDVARGVADAVRRVY